MAVFNENRPARGRKTTATPEHSAAAQKALKTLLERAGSWRAVAKDLPGFGPGYLNLVANGKRRPSDGLLAVLGLQRRPVAVPPCPVCGQVHLVPWCTEQDGQPRRQRRRVVSPYIRDWSSAHLRYAFEHREVMA